jgi:hypothetical protein
MITSCYDDAPGYLKAGFQGFAGAGKTRTAIELAIAVHHSFKLAGPIALFDTEDGGKYVAHIVKAATGQSLMGTRSRSFADACTFLHEVQKIPGAVAIVDSVTHIWRDLCDSFMAAVNEAREVAKKSRIDKLEFQHWAHVKGRWNREFSDVYLNAAAHVIICGRAGHTYSMEEDPDRPGKRELIVTGTKMKVETEFGFEPSLLVEMERVDGGGHQATVIKDRFGSLDGAQTVNPTGEFFAPHYSRLLPSAHEPVSAGTPTPHNVDEAGRAEWDRERRKREILVEKIAACFAKAGIGRSVDDEATKVALLEQCFGTTSKTEIAEKMNSGKLDAGLQMLEAEMAKRAASFQINVPDGGPMVLKPKKGKGK